ncbi:MAG: hypothetical protein ACYTFO_02010 [Planctomycetota bacterium]|jgi:hypothetical protein
MPLAASTDIAELLLWGFVLIVLLVALAAVVMWARRKMKAGPVGDDAFSIKQLERLREAGQLTDEEFRQLRLTALGLSTDRTPARDQNAPSGDGQRDDQGRPGRECPPYHETE